MIGQSKLDDFLHRNRISKEEWDSSKMKWEDLRAIGMDHESNSAHLEETASLMANVIQRFAKVHSVRWRVKDTEHLMAKIVRKRSEGGDKYENITVKNYKDIVTDLIGIRALHLFKVDFRDIDAYIRSCFELAEQPIAYIRDGDDQALSLRYQEAEFEVKNHPKGYRSIHYVATTQPLKQRILVEVQVRTIFEEGWSEIDHTLRYPNYSDNVQVEYLLAILNRLAGSADELGGFAQVLAHLLSEHEEELNQAKIARDESIKKMEEALEQLAVAKSDKAASARVVEVRRELEKLKVGQSVGESVGLGPDMLKRISENGVTISSSGDVSFSSGVMGGVHNARRLGEALKIGGLKMASGNGHVSDGVKKMNNLTEMLTRQFEDTTGMNSPIKKQDDTLQLVKKSKGSTE